MHTLNFSSSLFSAAHSLHELRVQETWGAITLMAERVFTADKSKNASKLAEAYLCQRRTYHAAIQAETKLFVPATPSKMGERELAILAIQVFIDRASEHLEKEIDGRTLGNAVQALGRACYDWTYCLVNLQRKVCVSGAVDRNKDAYERIVLHQLQSHGVYERELQRTSPTRRTQALLAPDETESTAMSVQAQLTDIITTDNMREVFADTVAPADEDEQKLFAVEYNSLLLAMVRVHYIGQAIKKHLGTLTEIGGCMLLCVWAKEETTQLLDCLVKQVAVADEKMANMRKHATEVFKQYRECHNTRNGRWARHPLRCRISESNGAETLMAKAEQRLKGIEGNLDEQVNFDRLGTYLTAIKAEVREIKLKGYKFKDDDARNQAQSARSGITTILERVGLKVSSSSSQFVAPPTNPQPALPGLAFHDQHACQIAADAAINSAEKELFRGHGQGFRVVVHHKPKEVAFRGAVLILHHNAKDVSNVELGSLWDLEDSVVIQHCETHRICSAQRQECSRAWETIRSRLEEISSSAQFTRSLAALLMLIASERCNIEGIGIYRGQGQPCSDAVQSLITSVAHQFEGEENERVKSTCTETFDQLQHPLGDATRATPLRGPRHGELAAAVMSHDTGQAIVPSDTPFASTFNVDDDFYTLLDFSDKEKRQYNPRTKEGRNLLKAKWRAAQRRWHPDKHPGNVEQATAQTQRVNMALKILREPGLKELYDQHMENTRKKSLWEKCRSFLKDKWGTLKKQWKASTGWGKGRILFGAILFAAGTAASVFSFGSGFATAALAFAVCGSSSVSFAGLGLAAHSLQNSGKPFERGGLASSVFFHATVGFVAGLAAPAAAFAGANLLTMFAAGGASSGVAARVAGGCTSGAYGRRLLLDDDGKVVKDPDTGEPMLETKGDQRLRIGKDLLMGVALGTSIGMLVGGVAHGATGGTLGGTLDSSTAFVHPLHGGTPHFSGQPSAALGGGNHSVVAHDALSYGANTERDMRNVLCEGDCAKGGPSNNYVELVCGQIFKCSLCPPKYSEAEPYINDRYACQFCKWQLCKGCFENVHRRQVCATPTANDTATDFPSPTSTPGPWAATAPTVDLFAPESFQASGTWRTTFIEARDNSPDAKNYTTYIIQVDYTSPQLVHCQWKTERRFSEFIKFRQRLKEQFALKVDDLPSRKLFGNMKQELIEQRGKKLIQWLDALTSSAFLDQNDGLVKTISEFLVSDAFDKKTEKFAQPGATQAVPIDPPGSPPLSPFLASPAHPMAHSYESARGTLSINSDCPIGVTADTALASSTSV